MVRVVWFPSGLQYAKRMGLNPVLDRASILFIKSEFHCGRFAPLRNSSIIIRKCNIVIRKVQYYNTKSAIL